MSNKKQIPRSVGIWLMVGVVMVFVQIVIGGITRLTDSGLSITEWNIIKGTLPPLTDIQWEEAYNKYQEHAHKQVEQLALEDMPMADFKFIYFWEYFHRLWARSMGLVFLIPFIYFWFKGYFTKRLLKRLGIVVFLAALAASFGWIMVMSGLDTNTYAWVDAYRLTVHLSIAVLLLGYLFWTALEVLQPKPVDTHHRRMRRYGWRITVILCLQIGLGGLMSGMRAGPVAPYFPHMQYDHETEERIWIPNALKVKDNWTVSKVFNYAEEGNEFSGSLVQLLHRGVAYILCVLIPIFFFTIRRVQVSKTLRIGNYVLLSMLIVQLLLGIFTVIGCRYGSIPVTLGVLHQAGGMLLLMAMLFVNYQVKKVHNYIKG